MESNILEANNVLAALLVTLQIRIINTNYYEQFGCIIIDEATQQDVTRDM